MSSFFELIFVMVWYTSTEHGYCFVLVLTYVLVLYAIPSRIRRFPRNHPEHIFYRMIAAGVATISLTTIFLLYFPKDSVFSENVSLFEVIGVRADNALASIAVSMLLMSIFYAGPLICQAHMLVTLTSSDVSHSGILKKKKSPISLFSSVYEFTISALTSNNTSSMILFRNIIFAPITEEVVFRALMIPLLYSYIKSDAQSKAIGLTHEEAKYIILTCPLYFGVAHIHHLVETIRTGSKILPAIVTTLVQFTYTSIFGAIAVVLFLRTGNVMAPITSHVICNLQGLPDIGFVRKSGTYESSPSSCLYDYRYIYIALYVGGLVAFSHLLFIFTESFQAPLYKY